MSGDKYTVWCGLLYSDSWFRRLEVLPTVTVTVRFVRHRYCTFCHFIKQQTWHTFVRCATPLHKNSIRGGISTKIKTHTCTDAEEINPVAPIWSRRSHHHRGQPRWNLTWRAVCWDYFVEMLKHRLIYNSLQKGQVVSGWGHHTAGDKQTPLATNVAHSHRTHFLCSLAKRHQTLSHLSHPNRQFLPFS